MQKTIKVLLVICLVVAGLFGLSRLYFALTDGFSVSSFTSDLAFDPKWETTPLSAEEQQKVKSILRQRFHYLGKGCQCYTLVSDDDRYVLKFFKFKHLHQNSWVDNLLLPDSLKKQRQISKQRRQAKLDLLFNGYKIAFEDLRKETGMVFVHLNKTNDLHIQLQFHDKLGIYHEINLDEVEFVLQTKAEMVYPIIKKLMNEGKQDKVEQIFVWIRELLIAISQKGITDRDPALIQNIGLLADRAILLDPGQLVKDEKVKDPTNYNQKIHQRFRELHSWVQTHYPALLPNLEKALDE